MIWDWWWNFNNNLRFHFRLFPRKTNDKIFQKTQKTLFWGHFGPFLLKFGWKWIFLEKRALPVFKHSNYLPSFHKSGKNNEPFLRKMPNWWRDRQRDGQTDNGDFIGRPSVGRGSKNTQVHSFLLGPTHANLIFPSKTLNSSLPFTEKILWNAFHVKHKQIYLLTRAKWTPLAVNLSIFSTPPGT